MKVSFLGAARTVTGSQHLISVNGHKLLLDCGLYQGRQQEAYEFNRKFDFDPAEISAVFLSHAHIDHSGNLPGLVKRGYEGPIYATRATAHLADIMLRDSAHIQESDADVAKEAAAGKGKKGNGGGWKPPEALYTQEDAARVREHFKPVGYNSPFEVVPGVNVKFVEAGHILGSAAVVLDIEEGGRTQRVWFSGDIGRRNLPLIKDPVLPEGVDTLIMECTYGDTQHADPLGAVDELREVLRRALERGGKVIVPAFAIGRTQELVYDVNQLMERGEIPRAPVFVDSPLAVEVSKIFSEHTELLDDEAKNFVAAAENRTALGFDLLTYVESVQESRDLQERAGPAIIISASGMLEAGRVVHHLQSSIGDPRNTVLIVSYQAPETLGRDLLEGAREVEIMGERLAVKAEVVRLAGLSAHAGQRLLVEYAASVKERVKEVFLVHGEAGAAEALRGRLEGAGMEKIYYPYLRQSMDI